MIKSADLFFSPKVLTKSPFCGIMLKEPILFIKGVDIVKVGITLDDDLLVRVDAFADRNYMSRSGLISLALTQYLNSQEMINAITDMSLSMRKIADSGEVDHDTLEQLEDFQRVAEMFSGYKK